jgi:hypothetical protein
VLNSQSLRACFITKRRIESNMTKADREMRISPRSLSSRHAFTSLVLGWHVTVSPGPALSNTPQNTEEPHRQWTALWIALVSLERHGTASHHLAACLPCILEWLASLSSSLVLSGVSVECQHHMITVLLATISYWSGQLKQGVNSPYNIQVGASFYT